MKNKILLFVLSSLILLVAAKSDKPAYRLFNTKGKIVDYADLLKRSKKGRYYFLWGDA